MKDIIDFIKSLLEAGKDRIRYPFVRAFALTFALYNWRPLSLLLFSEESMEYRVDTIQQCYMQGTGFMHLWHDYIMTPILLSLVFFLGMPYLSNWFEQLLGRAKNAKRNSRIDAEDKDLDRALEVATKKGEVEDATANWKDRHEMNQENKRLKSLEAAWKTELDDTVKLLDKAKAQVSDLDSLQTTVQTLGVKNNKLETVNSNMKGVLEEWFPNIPVEELSAEKALNTRKEQFLVLNKLLSKPFANWSVHKNKLSLEFVQHSESIKSFTENTKEWFINDALGAFLSDSDSPEYIRAGLLKEDKNISDYGYYVMAVTQAEQAGVLNLFQSLLRDRDKG